MLKKKKSGIFIYIVFCLYLIVLVYILLLKADLKFVSQGYAGVYQGTFQRPANYNIKPLVTIKAYFLNFIKFYLIFNHCFFLSLILLFGKNT